MWLKIPELITASVVMSGKTLTTIAPPIAELLLEPPAASAGFWRPILLVALTAASPDETRCAPAATEASVW